MPKACDCRAPRFLRLPRFTHGVVRRDADRLPPAVLQRLDELTAVDAELFGIALRLLLGRLRHVEEVTRVPLLRCVPWKRSGARRGDGWL